jgi:hypothetical protein
MKAAICIPDSLAESIESFIKAAKISRSEFFQRAARLYLDKVTANTVVANLNRVYGKTEEDPADVAFRRAALLHLRDLLEEEARGAESSIRAFS